MATKIVVCGDIDGRFREVFTDLAKLHEKHNFAFALFVGNFFKDEGNSKIVLDSEADDLMAGKIEVPMPVYFTLGRQIFSSAITDQLDAKNGELCPNVLAIGRRGFAKTTEGIRLVVSSGTHTESSMDRPSSVFAGGYTDNDAKGSCSYHDADILITSDWPENVEKGTPLPCAGPMGSKRSCIADLCSKLKPRYHFSTSLAFYQRPPFTHDAESKRTTRFIALAPFGNRNGEKAIFAFSIDHSVEPPAELPKGTTRSPLASFVANNKRKLASQQDEYRGHQNSNGQAEERRGKRNKTNKGPVMPASCFFCLSNPSCEHHMIGAIGQEAYVTVAKGPLPLRDTFPDLGYPGHMLIIPLEHVPTIASIPGEEQSDATMAEMLQYKNSMQDMLVAKSRDENGHAKLGAVTWEISRAGGVHNHWQFVPVPVALVTSGAVETAFKEEGDKLDYPAFMTEEDKVIAVEQGNCLRIDIWSENHRKRLAMPLDQSFRFDLQFARRVMAKLLGLSKRAQWQHCAQEKVEEEEDVHRFKELFKPFESPTD